MGREIIRVSVHKDRREMRVGTRGENLGNVRDRGGEKQVSEEKKRN